MSCINIKPFRIKVNYGTDPLGLPIVRTFFITNITRQQLSRDECRYFFTIVHIATGTSFPVDTDNVSTLEGLRRELRGSILNDPPYSILPRDKEREIVDLTNKLLFNPVDREQLAKKERLLVQLKKGL